MSIMTFEMFYFLGLTQFQHQFYATSDKDVVSFYCTQMPQLHKILENKQRSQTSIGKLQYQEKPHPEMQTTMGNQQELQVLCQQPDSAFYVSLEDDYPCSMTVPKQF